MFQCTHVLTSFCFSSEDNISPRVEDMVRRHYEELSFPVDEEHFGSNVSLYVRKRGALSVDIREN